MRTETPQTIRLEDYVPTPYAITEVFLEFVLEPEATRVRSRLKLEPRAGAAAGAPLILDGENIALVSVALDGRPLEAGSYEVDSRHLTIADVPARPFLLEIETTCDPKANTQLSGLYVSNGIYCTQCEAEGFRRITYFYDRPDVMARFRTHIEAPKATCPILLANGNPVAHGEVAGTDRHYALWDDPYPKPAYLFALVAGELKGVFDTFTTKSGRSIDLRIYVEPGKEDRCQWAMECLKTSMRWDEEAFGREYDLDVFMIVAVSSFNMGAMENKGLNIFNDKYILALPETATDVDYVNIEAIIAHEYFHNWTGNRITCRDWFQLCLKEGLTVFRDQEFTADIRSRSVKRIADVKALRARQFPEDAGPLSHPVRPSAYMEINNFYTATVYEKGAEVCRMLKVLIGEAAFAKAMDLYFERHDGQAATVEDFVACMADASGRDLTQFFAWYEQSGTPEVTVRERYDESRRAFELTLEQSTAPTPDQPVKKPLHTPLALGLVDGQGEDMALDLEGTGVLNEPLIELTKERQTFRFLNVPSRPVLSLNRGFSAPIRLKSKAMLADQVFLMGHDRDPFNRWEAGQAAGADLINAAIRREGGSPDVTDFAKALARLLRDPNLDDAFKALMLGLPTETDIATALGKDVDPDLIHGARERVRGAIGLALMPVLDELWHDRQERGPYRPDPAGTGRRALRYAVLQLIAGADPDKAARLSLGQFDQPHSMTDEIGALSALILIDRPERDAALAAFLDRHQDDHLLVDKWFALNAQVPCHATARRVRDLTRHEQFNLTQPNRVRGLIGSFTMANPVGFHAPDGEGYRVLADVVLELDPLNAQVAARIATGFGSWRALEAKRRTLAQAEMQRMLAVSQLSRDTYEIISRSLGGASST